MNRWSLAVLLSSAALAQNPQFLPDQNRPCWQLQPADSWSMYRQVLLADLDGDGDGDALTEARAGLAVHRQGAAAVWAYTLLPVAAGTSTPVGALVDLDGDGDLDVLAAAHTPMTWFAPAQVGVQVLTNDGSGSFSSNAVLSPSLNMVPYRIVAGDLDGDGDQDALLAGELAVGGTQPNTFLHLLRNQGGGSLQLVVGALPAAGAMCWPLIADFDGDGDRDVLVAQPGGPTLFLRNQAATFVADPTFLPAGAVGYRDLVAVDCDGDADVDVLATTTSGSVDLLRNVGAALTRTANVLTGSALQLGVGDLDGDGDADCVARTATSIVTHLNQGGGTFSQSSTITRPDATRCLAVGAIDGNGFADALVGWDHPVLSGLAYMGSPTGLLADPMVARVAAPIPGSPHAVPLPGADLNGDGRHDHLSLVADLAGSSWVRRLVADRFGALTASRFPMTFNSPRAAGLVDLDGDSDHDILCETYVDDCFWVPNNGTTFGPPVHLSSFSVTALAWGDVDGDGDVDLLEVDDFLPALVRFNNGNGVFSVGPALPETGWIYSREALLGDFDGDGDLDAITGRGSSGCLDVLRNNGNGTFVLQPGCAYPTGNSLPNGSRAADLDGDGDLDVVHWNAAETRLMINSGAATFTDQTASRLLPLPAYNVSDVVVFDADADGDPDLLLLRSGLLQLFYENDGAGVFSDVTFQRWGQVPNGVHGASADLDADGDQDVVVGQQIAWNHLRQLSSLQEPRLGGALVLRLHLEPDNLAVGFGLVAIAFQPLPASFQIPGIVGNIELVAAGHLPLVAMPSPLGVATQSLAIPPMAALLGTDLFCQALFLSSRTGLAVSGALAERIR